MAHNTEIVPIDHQFPVLIDQPPLRKATKDEIEEGRKADHSFEIMETNGHDQLVLQTQKSVNQMFDERFMNLDNTCIKSTTTFRVNIGLRKSNSDAYTPMLISIGPYHQRNLELGSMEKYKLLYLRRFLQRKEGLDVESCISALKKRKDEALKCYDDNLDSDKTTLFDIKFEKGLLKIPCFTIEGTMETFMRNLIAYEQHSSDAYSYFSNYAHIMTQLIGSHKDVNFLCQNKIILKDLGDHKEVAGIFKKLSDGVTITDFYYYEECSKLIQHCGERWNKTLASSRHNYFQTPWVGASTVPAITPLILTVIQTVLAFTGNVSK